MKWHKLGKVFDPRDWKLPNGCIEFAQSPQALVLDDRIRIYFSTREVDGSRGKYLSHVAYVDFDRDLRTIIAVSDVPVMALGKLGCFDEHGIFPLSPVRHKDRLMAYTCGWNRRVSVSIETAIGMALSTNQGVTFERLGDGPVLGSSLLEPCLVGDPFVRVYGDAFHMWYIFGKGWKRFAKNAPPDRVYKIAHAVSVDGVTWHKEEGRQLISDRLNADESQALPTVISIDSRYHMYFCYRQSSDFRTNKARSYRIGYAFSDNLKDWTRYDESGGIDVSEEGWDSEMMCYPHVFECGDRVFMLYNGNEFGRHGFGGAVLD